MAKNFENQTNAPHTQGQLRCATAEEYYYWLTGKHQRVGARTVILHPRKAFCTEATTRWCLRQRRQGRCHLSEHAFWQSIELRRSLRRRERDECRSVAPQSATSTDAPHCPEA
jgi:hypothetical protein